MTISGLGKGFPAEDKIKGLGPASMRRLAEGMEGTLRVDSSPGRGTETGLTVVAG